MLDSGAKEICAASNHDGRLEVFWVSPFNELWHHWQDIENQGWHSNAVKIADGVTDICAVSARPGPSAPNNQIHVFAISTAFGGGIRLWHFRQNGGFQLEDLGTPGSGLAPTHICAARNADRRVEVFASTSPPAGSTGPGEHVWHRYETLPAGGNTFSQWEDLT